MNVYELKSNREVCWDMHIVDTIEGNAHLQMHKPVKKNVALDCTEVWEDHCGWTAIMKLGDAYRLYYRTWGGREEKKEGYCVAESKDGKTFTRVPLSMYELAGTRENNVFFTEDRFIDNFSVHYDTNPNCPPDEKFKALSLLFIDPPVDTPNGPHYTDLLYYKSADGIHFEKVGVLDVPGVFDTYNVVFWDAEEKEYKMYVRDFHNEDGTRSSYEPTAAMEIAYRDIRLARSKDFVHWTEPEMIKFSDGDQNIQLYINQIIKYPRANDMYLGTPVRYIKRAEEAVNFKYLPTWNGERTKLLSEGNRIGSVATDCVLMTSRDGFHFDRCNEAFMAPGIENVYNWTYGECYLSHGVAETLCDDNENVTELSFYTGEGHRGEHTKIVRYTVRLDGFFSWHGDFAGGTVMTVPVTFDGNALEINFATSALGYVRIIICDENGKELKGYDSGTLFGNSLSRNVDFEKPLSGLAAKTVRLKIELKDADIYSFKFC